MSTARHYVSLVRADLNKFSPDHFISDRHILATILPINNQLLSRQVSERKAWGIDQLFTRIDCLEMEQVPLYSCCDVDSDCMIARSKKKLPLIVDSYYSLVIRSVQSLDNKVKFNELNTPERYANLLKLYPKQIKPYFFMKNGYLYITNPDIETISITAMFKELLDPLEFSCEGEAPKCKTNPLDLEFKTLPKLETDIVRLTVQAIASTFQQLPGERNSGDMIVNN